MKLVTSIATVAGLCAGMAHAQAVEQGPSGNPAYPVTVLAEDGTTFFCKAENELRDGRPVRVCQRQSGAAVRGGGDPFGAGGPSLAIAAGAAGLGLIALIVANDTTN